MPWFHGVIALRVCFVLSFFFWREGQYVQDVSVHGLLKRGTPRLFAPEFPFERSTRRGRRRIENLLLSTTALIKSQMAAIRGRLSVIVYGQPVVLACKQIEPGYALAAEKVSVQTFSLPASSLCGVCFFLLFCRCLQLALSDNQDTRHVASYQRSFLPSDKTREIGRGEGTSYVPKTT